MIAGRLEIELQADIARLRKDLGDARGMLSGWAREVDGTLKSAKGMFAAFGVGLSTTAILAFTKASIDALDSLNDLSKTTRIAADDLAGLRFAAQLSGTNLEATAGAINKLAINMGKNGEKFAALGVSARDPIEALKQLADVTNAIADPQQRAAVLAEALGKSWQQVAPLLAEGSAKIGEMVTKGKEMSGVTQALVEQADAFNDKLTEIAGNGGAVNAVLAQLLPLLNATADGILENGKATTMWEAAGKVLAEILRVLVVLGGNVMFVLRGIGTEIGGLAAQAAAVATGDFARAAAIGRQMKADAEANRKAFDAWEKSIMAVGTASKATTKALDAEDQVSRRMAQDAAAAARAFLEAEERKKAAAKAAVEAAREAEKLRKDDIDGWVKYADAVFEEADRLNLDLAKISDRYWKNEDANRERSDAEWVKYIDGQIEEYERGLTEMAALQPSFIERWSAMLEQVSDVAGQFFSDLVFNGKSAFDNLRRWVKQLLADMIALFAKRWVLNMAAGGSVWGSAAQAATGGGGSDSLAGTALNWAGSAMGLTGAGGAASMFMGGMTGAIPAGAIGSGAVAAGVGTTSTAAAAGSALSGVYSALAAIPVWGWIAMAVIAIGAWIAGNKAGGPKVGGSFFGGGAVPGTDNGRFFTPSQGDEQMRALVNATSQGYEDAITRLGGNASAFNFGLGFDHDPNGSARSRVSSMVTDEQGRVLYSALDREMDDKEVEGALGLEAQRMLLVALQHSNLPPAIAEVLNSLVAETATPEQIAAAIAAAQEIKNVIDVLAIIGVEGLNVEALQAMQREGETLTATLNSVAQAQQAYYELFYTEEENLARNTDMLRRQFEAMGLEMPATREAFRAMVEGLDLTTESGAQLYRWLIEIAPAFADLVPALEEIPPVVEEITEVVHDLQNAIHDSRSIGSLAEGLLGDFNRRMSGVLGATDDPLARYALSGAMAQEQIEANKARMREIEQSGGTTLTTEWFKLQAMNDLLGAQAAKDAKAVADLTILIAQYGDVVGEQVFELDRWYAEQKALVGGNQAALLALEEIYGKRRLEIVERQSSELERYLSGSLLGRNSPLDPMQQLAEAQRQFDSAIAGGNADSIISSRNALLDIARRLYGSTSPYIEIFKKTFDQVADVGDLADYNTRMIELETRSQQIQQESYSVLIQIRDNAVSTAEMLADVIERSGARAAASAEWQPR